MYIFQPIYECTFIYNPSRYTSSMASLYVSARYDTKSQHKHAVAEDVGPDAGCDLDLGVGVGDYYCSHPIKSVVITLSQSKYVIITLSQLINSLLFSANYNPRALTQAVDSVVHLVWVRVQVVVLHEVGGA